MGNHRMFANTIIDSDLFLEMPLSTQALYFHLGMRADDEGFIGNPKKIIRAITCTEDDLKLLIAKGFVISFENGIIVITHWNLHNSIRKDRKRETFFQHEKALLELDGRNVYLLCHSDGNHMSAQDKISKDKLSEVNLSDMSTCVDARFDFDCQAVVKLFNSICKSLPSVQKLTDKRKKLIIGAEKLLSESSFTMTFEQLFRIVESSDFLTGRSGGWNGCGFDWILNLTNLTKIIEGNYKNKVTVSAPITRDYGEEF